MIRSNRRNALLSIVAVLIVILVMMLAAEAVVRARQYVKYGTFFDVNDFPVDEALGFRTLKEGMKTGSISVNSLGFRGPEIEMPKPDDRLRIAFIGASATYCAEVSDNDMVWTELARRGLESTFSGLSVDYINGGVPGYTTRESLINMKKRVLPLQPDVVVIYHANNDLALETRNLAEASGIQRTNLATEQSWLARFSLLWQLAEKNYLLLMVQKPSESELLDLNTRSIGDDFRRNLEELVNVANRNEVKMVVLVTFSIHLRDGMTTEQVKAAMVSARYYMPYLSEYDLVAGFKQYNQIIRDVAKDTGALLIEHENAIPGDSVHFNDSVHFTDEGSRAQAKRIVAALVDSEAFRVIVAAKR